MCLASECPLGCSGCSFVTLAHGSQLNCLPNTLKELLPMQVQPVRLDCSQFGTPFESQRALFYLNSDAVTIFGNKILALKGFSEQQCLQRRSGDCNYYLSPTMNFIPSKMNKTSQAIQSYKNPASFTYHL